MSNIRRVCYFSLQACCQTNQRFEIEIEVEAQVDLSCLDLLFGHLPEMRFGVAVEE